MGGWLRSHLGAQRPGGPACPAGVPISPEKWGERGPGASPLDPQLYSPLAAARSFWELLSLIRQRGDFLRNSKTDLGRIFREKICWKEFSRKKVPKSGHVHGQRNSPSTVSLRLTTPKRASGSERVINRGSRGRSPRRSFLRLSPEKAGLPPGVGRETHGAGSNLRHPPPSQATPGRSFFVKSFEIHCVFLAIFDKKCYPKNEERETSPEGHRNHRRPQERRGTG